MTLTFPTHLFNPASVKLQRRGVVITGGESLSQEVDTIQTDGGGYWAVEMRGIELLSDDLLRAWRAWEDELAGGLVPVNVPVLDVRRAPRPLIGGALASPSSIAPTDTDPYFPEAVGFATPLVTAATVGITALRATQIVIDVTRGARIKGGETVSIEHATKGNRTYRLGRVLARDEQEATVKLWPPLREATPNGTALNFDWPLMAATLIPNTDISPDVLYERSARVDIAFREAGVIA